LILYLENGKIIGSGDIVENPTHYIIGTTYYDKNTCEKVDLILPNEFNKENYIFKDGELIKIKPTLITRNQFNNLLGRDTIKNLLIAAKTDVDIETFKFFLSSCDKGIDLQDLNLIDGMNYLLYKGYVTQDIYNNIMN